jgi:hypothetical protein
MPMTAAYKRYYAKNRETILEKGRERDRAKREARRQYLESHPDEMEKEREAMRTKYYKSVARKVKTMIEDWLKDSMVDDAFKTFLRDFCLQDNRYEHMTPKALEILRQTAIKPLQEILGEDPHYYTGKYIEQQK